MVARNWNWWPSLLEFGLRDQADHSSTGLLPDDGEPRIGVIHDPMRRPIKFEAVGLSSTDLAPLRSLPPTADAFWDVFAVIASDESDHTPPSPVAGTYWIDGSRLTFIPRQLLRAGRTYQAVLRLRDSATSGSRQVWAMTIRREIDVPEHRFENELDRRWSPPLSSLSLDSSTKDPRFDLTDRAFPLDTSGPHSPTRVPQGRQHSLAHTSSTVRSNEPSH